MKILWVDQFPRWQYQALLQSALGFWSLSLWGEWSLKEQRRPLPKRHKIKWKYRSLSFFLLNWGESLRSSSCSYFCLAGCDPARRRTSRACWSRNRWPGRWASRGRSSWRPSSECRRGKPGWCWPACPTRSRRWNQMLGWTTMAVGRFRSPSYVRR